MLSQYEQNRNIVGVQDVTTKLSEPDNERLRRALDTLNKVHLKPGQHHLTMEEIVEECRIVRAERHAQRGA